MTTTPPTCPRCSHHLPLSVCLPYLIYSYRHAITCPHCGAMLVPDHYPVSFSTGYIVGFTTIYISTNIFLYLLHWDFLESALISLLVVSVPVLLVCRKTLSEITFREK